MGSSWSRSKKVSPECVKTVNDESVSSSSKHRALTIHGLLRVVRHRAPPQQDSPGAESERCAPGDDESARLETRSTRTSPAGKAFSRFSGDAEDQRRRASTEPRAGQRHVSDRAREHAGDRHMRPSSSQSSLLRCPPTGRSSLPSPAESDLPPVTHRTSSGRPLLAIPVHYNGSEEDLMERIEREFS